EVAHFEAHVHLTEKDKIRIRDSRIQVTLARLEGEKAEKEIPVIEETVGRGPGNYSYHFKPTTGGGYRFKAAAIATDGTTVDSDSLDLDVAVPDAESENPKANLK